MKVNVDENQELAAHFQTRSIPHVIAFADGRPVDQFVGVLPEGQLRASSTGCCRRPRKPNGVPRSMRWPRRATTTRSRTSKRRSR